MHEKRHDMTDQQEFADTLLNMDYAHMLRAACARHADATAFCVYDGSGAGNGLRPTASYRQLWEDVRRNDGYWRRAHGGGRHVMLLGENSYDWFVILSGIICSGSVVVPMDAHASAREIEETAGDADVDVIVVDSIDRMNGTAVPANVPVITMRSVMAAAAAVLPDDASQDDTPDDPTRTCLLMGTSGTTERRKYCMLSERNMIVAALNLFATVPIDSGGVVLSILPFSHCFGLNLGILYHLISGSTIVTGVRQETFMEALATVRPRYAMCVPGIIAALNLYFRITPSEQVRRIAENLREVYCGGAPISEEVAARFMDHGIELIIGYGLTECSPIVSANIPGRATAGTVGEPCRYVDIRFTDGGELEVRSPAVMNGYYRNPEATAAAMDGQWLRTGDLGHVDGQGSIVITGRAKNVIVLSNGENVSPEEVEGLVLRDEGITYCKVYADRDNVVADLFTNTLSDEQVRDVVDRANAMLSPFKRIRRYRLLDRLPAVTALGKVVRHD